MIWCNHLLIICLLFICEKVFDSSNIIFLLNNLITKSAKARLMVYALKNEL